MRLTVVGCAGSVAGPGNPASCYLLEADAWVGEDARTWRVVLDLGGGAIGPLQEIVDPATIDAILMSHGHQDHCADLASLSVLLRYGPASSALPAPIRLWGPPGLDERLKQIAGADDDAYLAFRIEGPSEGGGTAVCVFTGDTDLCEEVVALASGADVLLAEAGWAHRLENPSGIHMTGAQCGTLARRAGVQRVVVTHVASWVDPAKTLAQAAAEHSDALLATPGLVVSM